MGPGAGTGRGAPGFRRVREFPGGIEILEVVQFSVSYAPLPDPGFDALPEKVKRRISELKGPLETNAPLLMEELTYYAALYPDVPMFSNWLAKALYEDSRVEEAKGIMERTLNRHPDYVSGKLILAEFAMRDGDLARADELLGDPRTPRSLAPQREVFHASELLGYFALCGERDLRDGNVKAARSALGVIEEIAPGHPMSRRLRERCDEVERGEDRGRRPFAAA